MEGSVLKCKRSVLIFFFCFFSLPQSIAKEIKSYNLNKIKRVREALNSKGIKNHLRKEITKQVIFSLHLRDQKKYRSVRMKRSKKRFIRGKLYFEQYASLQIKNIRAALSIFLKKGFLKKDFKVLKQEKQRIRYRLTFSSKEEGEEMEKDESSILNYQMAQSHIKGERRESLNAQSFGNYVDVLSGIEFENDKYAAKLMFRAEHFLEKSQLGEMKKTYIDLGESFLNFEVGQGQITIGRQLFSWGVFDELSNLDRVNIKNLPRFVFDSGEAYRRPISSVRYEYYSGNWKFDSYIDFGLEPGKELDDKSLWTGVDRRKGALRGADPNILPPSIVSNVSAHFGKRESPGGGFRLTYSKNEDISLTFLRAYGDLPVFSFSTLLEKQMMSSTVDLAGLDAGINLNFEKETIFGIDFAKTLAGQLYKIEVSYVPDSRVVTSSFSLEEIPKFRFSIGGDFEFDTLSTTLVWQAVSEEVITEKQTLLEKKLLQYVFQFSQRYFEDKLEVGGRSILNSNDLSTYISPFLNYELSDSDNIGLTINLFNGEKNSFFGYHRGDSFAALSYKKLF